MPARAFHEHRCPVCDWEWSCVNGGCHRPYECPCPNCEDDYAEDSRADVEAAALGLPTRYLRCADDDQRDLDF